LIPHTILLETVMTRIRPLAILGIIALLGLSATACSDVTGPQPKSSFCPITGGPGTCDDPH
jgi:hypothetical protein